MTEQTRTGAISGLLFPKDLQKRFVLQLDLLAQLVVGNQVYVLRPVFSCYGHVAAVGDEVGNFDDSEFCIESLRQNRLRKKYVCKTHLQRQR